MHNLSFTDINGENHSISVETFFDDSIQVPAGFNHYKIINSPLDIVGAINIMNIVNIFINKDTGELKILLPLGSAPYRLIGKLGA